MAYQDLLAPGPKPWATLYLNAVQLQAGAGIGKVLVCEDSSGSAAWGNSVPASQVFTYSVTLSGPWATPQGPIDISFVKNGKQVMFSTPYFVPPAVQTSSTFITSSTFDPDPSLTPSAIYMDGGPVLAGNFFDGGGNFPDPGNQFPYGFIVPVFAGASSFIEMLNGNASGFFSGSGQVGPQSFTSAYVTDT